MPYHKIARAALHEQLAVIERQREVVVSIVPNHEDAEFFDVFTRDGDQVETRGDVA